ncbi:MAG: hypothetical protein ACRDSL_16910 [Pseudonocardiaceae bacterium]
MKAACFAVSSTVSGIDRIDLPGFAGGEAGHVDFPYSGPIMEHCPRASAGEAPPIDPALYWRDDMRRRAVPARLQVIYRVLRDEAGAVPACAPEATPQHIQPGTLSGQLPRIHRHGPPDQGLTVQMTTAGASI